MPTSTLFAKLNLKDQDEILVLNAPRSFDAELAQLLEVTRRRKLPRKGPEAFALAFVTKPAEVDALPS